MLEFFELNLDVIGWWELITDPTAIHCWQQPLKKKG